MSHLDNAFCDKIHSASLQLLQKIGVKLDHPRVLDMVLKAGGKPGPGADSVTFDPELVREKLKGQTP